MSVNPLNPRQQFQTVDVLRLEVETQPASGLKNYAINPSGELGAFWWTGNDPALFVHPYTNTLGLPALQFEVGTGGIYYVWMSGLIPIEPGQWAGGRLDVNQVSKRILLQFQFYAVDRTTQIGAADFTDVTTTGTFYVPPTQAPAGAAYVRLWIKPVTAATGTPSAGDKAAIRRTMITKSATDPGTSFEYVEPYAFTNILSGSHEIEISRAALDVGTLKATIVDPALDPAVDPADVLAVGRRARVMAYRAELGTWEPLFTGTIRDLRTDYVLDKDNPAQVRPRVTLTATDALADMANIAWPEAYNGALDLTKAFKGGSVPWLFEGASGFGYAATPWSRNANASLVDAVAVTRDSLGMGSDVNRAPGHAWLDRFGVLQLWQTPPTERDFTAWLAPTGGSPTLTNATSAIINSNVHDGATPGVRPQYQLHTIADGDVIAADSGAYPYVIVAPGRVYDVSVWFAHGGLGAAVRPVQLVVEFEGEFPGILQTTIVDEKIEPIGGWMQLAGRVTAPPGARYMRRKIVFKSALSGEYYYIDELRSQAVLVAYTNAATAAVPGNFTDSYTDIAVDWAVASVVNTVTINFLRTPPNAQDDSETIVYGPYVDQDSVDANGAFGVTLTLNGFEDITDIEAVARAILTANAQPVRTVESMTVAVQNAAGIRHAVQVDLCDLLAVDYAGLVASTPRVQALTHRITPEGWSVEYSFAPAGSTALPQVIPAPAVGAVSTSSSGTTQVFRVGPLLIQTGSLSTPSTSGTSWSGSVTFPVAFSSPPKVALTPGSRVHNWGVGTPSNTGFAWDAQWVDGSAHTNGGSAQWIAIGAS